MRYLILLATSLTLFSTATYTAQSPAPPAQQDSSPAQQPPQATSPSPTSSPGASTDPAKQKKVWTNEDFSAVKNRESAASISKLPSKSPSAANKPVDANYIAKTKKQLEKLQGDISDLDKQIAQLKSFSEGEPVSPSGAIKINKSYNRDPIDFQIRELQDKRNQLQDQMDALLDEARKKGVEPGQLR
jgi:hypothetical protein